MMFRCVRPRQGVRRAVPFVSVVSQTRFISAHIGSWCFTRLTPRGLAIQTRHFYTCSRLSSASTGALLSHDPTTSSRVFLGRCEQRRFAAEAANSQTTATNADSKREEQQQQPPPGGNDHPQANATFIGKLRYDTTRYPEIYNSINMINMLIFTVFCLCSTGTEAEAAFWLNEWGIDQAFRPLAWFLHSWLTNNFLSMSFAMMLFHSLGHATLAQIGPRKLTLFLAIVTSVSGFLMWSVAYARGYSEEKQFGPWDAIAALMVMQYLAVGTTPWGLLLSYTGWVRYANIVGAVLITYYDPQPLFFGTLIGLLLTKGRVIPPLAPKV